MSNRLGQRIAALLTSLTGESPPFPPTLLFNEGWLLRLILDSFARQPLTDHPLAFAPGARWFSEALLPSAFLPRHCGDPLGEAHTHADGAIGHFSVGQTGRTDLWLHEDAAQFVVLEAKLFSGLSAGISRIPYFDQVARNVACIAEVLRRSKRPPEEMSHLGFFVLAPQEQIDLGLFDASLSHDAIKAKVQRRVEAYGGEKDRWHAEWFTPYSTAYDSAS